MGSGRWRYLTPPSPPATGPALVQPESILSTEPLQAGAPEQTGKWCIGYRGCLVGAYCIGAKDADSLTPVVRKHYRGKPVDFAAQPSGYFTSFPGFRALAT